MEVMLASLILLVGIMGLAQLNRGLFAGFDPGQSSGVNQHPAIVENLLRDQVERVRQTRTATPVSDLVTPLGTYSAQVVAQGAPVIGARLTVQRYEAVLRFQAVGQPAPGEVAGRIVFDTVSNGPEGAGL